MHLDDYCDEDTVTEYGMGEKDEYGNYTMRLFKFQLQPTERIDMENDDTRLSLQELNQAVSGFFDMYIKFVTAYMQVHEVYKLFLTKYFHQKEAFSTGNEVAQYFEGFNRVKANSFKKIKCRMESFGYKVLRGEDDNLILCEEIGFNDLESFLYYDFLNGIKQNYVPNCCKNCGKFFLIKGSWYYTYCDRKLRKEFGKTCCDVGSKKRYDDKCKNDPVWQTCNRGVQGALCEVHEKEDDGFRV